MPLLLQTSHILTKPKWYFFFDEQRAITLEAHGITWIILELEQDILVLSIVSKFRKVPFEITELETLHHKQWQNLKNKEVILRYRLLKIEKDILVLNIVNKFDSSDQNYLI